MYTPSNLRLVVSPGGGSEGGGEDSQEPATKQKPDDDEFPAQPGTRPGPAQSQLSAHSDHCDKLTVDRLVTCRVCQVTNYDRRQDKQEHPVCIKVESLVSVFTCETKFTTLFPSVDCDMR